MGRKNLGYQARTEIVHTHEQRDAWERAAKLEGLPLSEWIRRSLDHASGLMERRIQNAKKPRRQ